MVLLLARNIENILQQGLAPVPTTTKRIHALTITQPSGTPLTTTVDPSTSKTCPVTKVKIFSLLAVRTGFSDEVEKFEIDDPEKDAYGVLVPETKFGVVAICEKGYPRGVMAMKLVNIAESLKELKKFE